ncbi:hypothetical protein AB4K20DRAFT_1871527 [Rhizopus microsporus]
MGRIFKHLAAKTVIQGRGRRITQERITLLYHLKSDPLFRNKTLPLILLLYPLCFEMNFFYEDGRGGIVDDFGNEAAAFVVDPCFRLANLTNLHNHRRKRRAKRHGYAGSNHQEGKKLNLFYTNEDRLRYFFFLHEKLMKPAEAAKLANVNPETARKWKREYERDPEKKIPFKKTNHISNRAPSQLNENHKMHLINFFDENPSAVIQDAVENLTKSFEGLEIKKSRVAEFMKEDCNLSIKLLVQFQHLVL